MFNLQPYLERKRRIIEAALDVVLPKENVQPVVLHQAMRYSVFSGGKRVRPIVCLSAAEAMGGRSRDAILAALAIELLHTYTLIHDDLPCMDDDDFRRGKLACHVVFDEANAVLAGDALQALAFEALARAKAPARYHSNQLVRELARAAGSCGVVGGQAEDLMFAKRKPSADLVHFVHLHKTADLFRAAARMGGIAANATRKQLKALTQYGANLGMAFQITDDLLDSRTAGKRTKGKSGKEDGMTCLSVYAPDTARKNAGKFINGAIAAVQAGATKDARPLVAIARFVLERAS